MASRETTLLESASAEDSFAVIGAVLRAARIDKGMALEDVAQDLRYSKSYVRHLENGDFDLLPGSTYVAGYLRSYGQLLDIDGPALVARYQALLNPVDMRPTHKFPVPGQRPQRSGAVVASFVVMIAAVGYVGWYWAEKPGLEALIPEQETAQLLDTVSPTSPEPDGLASVNEASLLSDDAQTDTDNAATPNANEASTGGLTPTQPSTEDIAVAAADNSASAASDDDQTPNDDAVTETAAAEPATTAPDPDMLADSDKGTPNPGAAVANARDETYDITLRATASSWVEIVRNDGEEVMTKLMRDGDVYIIDGGENLYLSTGNAGGLEFVLRDGSVLSAGDVGEILRDLPLKPDGLIDNL